MLRNVTFCENFIFLFFFFKIKKFFLFFYKGVLVYKVKIYKIYKIRKIKLLRLRPLQISAVKIWAKNFLMLIFEFLVSKYAEKPFG